MKLPPKMPQRAMVRIWAASLHQEIAPRNVSFWVLFCLCNPLCNPLFQLDFERRSPCIRKRPIKRSSSTRMNHFMLRHWPNWLRRFGSTRRSGRDSGGQNFYKYKNSPEGQMAPGAVAMLWTYSGALSARCSSSARRPHRQRGRPG